MENKGDGYVPQGGAASWDWLSSCCWRSKAHAATSAPPSATVFYKAPPPDVGSAYIAGAAALAPLPCEPLCLVPGRKEELDDSLRQTAESLIAEQASPRQAAVANAEPSGQTSSAVAEKNPAAAPEARTTTRFKAPPPMQDCCVITVVSALSGALFYGPQTVHRDQSTSTLLRHLQHIQSIQDQTPSCIRLMFDDRVLDSCMTVTQYQCIARLKKESEPDVRLEMIQQQLLLTWEDLNAMPPSRNIVRSRHVRATLNCQRELRQFCIDHNRSRVDVEVEKKLRLAQVSPNTGWAPQ